MAHSSKAPPEWREPLKAEFQKRLGLLKDTGWTRHITMPGFTHAYGIAVGVAKSGCWSSLSSHGTVASYWLGLHRAYNIFDDGRVVKMTTLYLGPLMLTWARCPG